jgi:hypothetical protein
MTNQEVSQLKVRLQISDHINKDLSFLFRIPTVTFWNRLEGRPRSEDLEKALRADIRDPLWMLARQWQLGEYKGEDAGMPIRAKVLAETSPISSIGMKDKPRRAYDPNQPLEFVVEAQTVVPDLMRSLYIGQDWSRQLAQTQSGGSKVLDSFKKSKTYGIHEPVENLKNSEKPTVWIEPSNQVTEEPPSKSPKDLESLIGITQRRLLETRLAVSGRSINGLQLLTDIAEALKAGKSPAAQFADQGVAIPNAAVANKVDTLARDFKAKWYDKLFPTSSGDEDAWVPEHLEHNFSLGISNGDRTETKLIADQYPGGHLDWYSFEVVSSDQDGVENTNLSKVRVKKSFIPTPLRFPGMPNVRWWEFEDNRVGFGLTTAAKTDLVKLLLAEFGLVFSNDWFILPFRADVGTLIDTKGIVVTDNFGFNTLIEPTAKRHADAGLAGNWGLWTLSKRDVPGTVDTRFFLAPALARSLESKPVEEVVFLRDEMANLVWAVEAVIPDPLGGGLDARATGKLLREAIAKAYPQEPDSDIVKDVLLRYQLMGSVPENWIPLVSVRLQGESASTAFLQGAMPRVPQLEPLADATDQQKLAHKVVLPRGSILARDPVSHPNVIHEEELLRSGSLVQRSFQQARWHDGTTFTWIGRKKQNGRGEGSSGLAFDQLILRKPEK